MNEFIYDLQKFIPKYIVKILCLRFLIRSETKYKYTIIYYLTIKFKKSTTCLQQCFLIFLKIIIGDPMHNFQYL